MVFPLVPTMYSVPAICSRAVAHIPRSALSFFVHTFGRSQIYKISKEAVCACACACFKFVFLCVCVLVQSRRIKLRVCLVLAIRGR